MSDKTNVYRNGNICRIYMKNFLTYDEIEIKPKPHLNVIIGPNGTGKSSILCGICIGLAGKPELTGRGKHISEYVKHGKDNSVLEIELFSKEGADNVIIRREFTRDTKSRSRWFLQGGEVKEKEIETKVVSMGIQVNNLCQFLPQDRVVEFAKMNKIQLLSSTEKAVGKMELFREHEILKNNGETLQDINARLNDVKNQLANEIKNNDRLKDQVRNIELKEELDKAIKELRLLIVFYNYNEKRKKHKELQQPIRRLKEECNTLEAKMKPNRDKVQKITQQLNRHLSMVKKSNEGTQDMYKELEELGNQWDKKEEEIVIAQEEFQNLEESNSKRGREINDLKKQLQLLLRQVAEVKHIDESELSLKIKTLTDQINSESQKFASIQNQCGNIKIEVNAISEHRKHYEKKLSDVRDIRTRRLQILQTKNRDAYTATQWLRNNRHQFRGTVHDPMFSTIDFTDLSYSKYLENTVSNRDLVAFICEDKYDVKTLKAQADANRWSINILHSSPVHPDTYKPSCSIKNLRRLGFEAFIKDVVSAPPAVLTYLCRQYKIHNIPFAQVADYDSVPVEFNLFFIGKQRFSRGKSRYDDGRYTRISEIREAVYLSLSSNPRDEQQIQKELNELNERCQTLQASSQGLSAEEKKVEDQLDRLRGEKQQLMMRKDDRRRLQLKISQKQEQISRREENEIDLASARRKMCSKLKKAMEGMFQVAVKQSQMENRVTNHAKDFLNKSFVGSELLQEKKALTRAMENGSMEKNKKMEEKERLMKESEEYGNTAKQLLEKFTSDLGLTSHTQIPQEITSSLMVKLSKKNMEELEDNLAEKEAHRNCIITSDDSVLLEYKRREDKIWKLRKDEENITATMNKETDSVESVRKSWLPGITELTSKINTHFSKFMDNLGCAGEVQLDKGNDENNFSQYGLAIRVKFRDTERLKELTAHEQSGGERSVSTALYLMSLQTLTAVPFRCVDEINQGMDPTNERNMFTMLVETTTTETASQYFLITPKLLPNLPYNRFVNFLNTLNWCSTSTIRQLNTPKVIAYYKKRNMHRRRKRES